MWYPIKGCLFERNRLFIVNGGFQPFKAVWSSSSQPLILVTSAINLTYFVFDVRHVVMVIERETDYY